MNVFILHQIFGPKSVLEIGVNLICQIFSSKGMYPSTLSSKHSLSHHQQREPGTEITDKRVALLPKSPLGRV